MAREASPTDTPRRASSASCSLYRSPWLRAWSKIVGLEVTPTTCRSRARAARLPLVSRTRLMSSSQMATPAADSSASASECVVMTVAPLLTGVRTCRTGIPSRLGQARHRRGHHVLRGQPEVLVEVLVTRAGAEVLQAHALARVTGERPPAERDARLDAHACPHPGRQHLPLVGSVLRGEPFHARHGD